MPSSNMQDQVVLFLDQFAERETRVRSLLDLSLGRILENDRDTFSAGVAVPSVKRIVEWLEAAITSQAEWLSYVDELGRPKKLFIFESVGQLLNEAEHDLAMFSARVDRVGLIDGDEEFFAKLSEDYYLVKLVKPWALDREGDRLGSSIGNGYYDKKLKWDNHAILSLRDNSGKPLGILVLENNELKGASGPNGDRLEAGLMKLVMQFVIDQNYKCFLPSWLTGYVMDTRGVFHSVYALPDGLSVQGDLWLGGVDIKQLPRGLKTTGCLSITGSRITSLPDDLVIGESLKMEHTLIEALPAGIQVKIGIFAEGSRLKDIPPNFSHRGTLDLSNTPIRNLPEGLDLYALILSGCQLQSLPKRLKVRNYLKVNNGLVDCLPGDLYVGEFLSSDGAKFGWVPMSVPNDVLIPLPYDMEITVGEHRRKIFPKLVAEQIKRLVRMGKSVLGRAISGKPAQ